MALLAIFRNIRYLFLAITVTATVFTLISIFSQTRLLIDIIPDNGITFYEKLSIIVAILYGAITEITSNSILTFTIAMLFGISTAGIVYYFRLYRATAVSAMSAFTAGGALSGIVALGCAACGSLAIGFLASFFSASSLLVFVPYQSVGFGMLSITMLSASLYVLNKKLARI